MFICNYLPSVKCCYFHSDIKGRVLQACGPGSSVGIATELRAGRSGDRIPVGARFSAPVQTGPGAHPASRTMGTGSFPGVKSGRGVTLTPHTLLVLWSRKSRAIPLLPLWAVRLVQSLSACTRVHFTTGLLCHLCLPCFLNSHHVVMRAVQGWIHARVTLFRDTMAQ